MTIEPACQCFGCKAKRGAHRRYVLVCGGCAAAVDEVARLRRNAGERESRRSRARPSLPLCATAGCGVAVWASHARYCKACSDERLAQQRRAYARARAAARPVRLCGCGKPVRKVKRGTAKFCEACAAGRAEKLPRLTLEEARAHRRGNSRRSMHKLRSDPAYRAAERAKTRERMRRRRARSNPTNQEATR